MLYRNYKAFLGLSIISCAVSVTFSQLFLGVAFLFWLFLPQKPSFRTPLVLVLFYFYLWQMLTFFFNGVSHADPGKVLLQGMRAEMKDVLLLSAFFVVHGLKKEDRPYLVKTFQAFAWVLLLTGFVSIFSETRLSRLLSDLYKQSASWPYQHHYGIHGGIGFYLPIGLMNTHLTYGGLLSFVSPYFLFTFLIAWERKVSVRELLQKAFPLLLLLPVVLLNNARSAILGSVVSCIFGFYIFTFVRPLFHKRTYSLLGGLALGAVLLIVVGFFTVPVVQRTVAPLFGEEKHTDSGRTFIWDSTFPLIEKNPFFGIGPGQYPEQIEQSRKQRSLLYPNLLFFYEVTQRGHSHNDYFHLAVIYGIPSALLYILLGMLIVYSLPGLPTQAENQVWVLGLVGFFFSGLLQCYFQDDEVLIVFFYLLGLFSIFSKEDSPNQ